MKQKLLKMVGVLLLALVLSIGAVTIWIGRKITKVLRGKDKQFDGFDADDEL